MEVEEEEQEGEEGSEVGLALGLFVLLSCRCEGRRAS
jgi:hypothetical protein